MKKNMSEVGFEPTPTFVDQNAPGHFIGQRISSLSLAPYAHAHAHPDNGH